MLSDPLNDDFGRTVDSSLVLHAVGDRGKMLENSAAVLEKLGACNSGRQAVLDRRLFGADGSGGDDEEMPVLRTFGLA